eukprot:1523600-Rhodomonas_salina.1
MTPIATQRALSAAEIKIKLLEKALQQKKPSRYSMLSTGSDMDEGGSSFARSTLEKPWTFKGEYSELYNVLNWIHSVEWYLRQCQVRPEDYASYVRSYLARVVQAWMDGRFPAKTYNLIPWLELHTAMIDQYLPPDHEIRLQLVFERTVQCTTLLEYVERFQVLDSAV